jgi:hypothetical protein
MSIEDKNAESLLTAFERILEPPTPPRVRARFEPWHKPRKHYVRTYYWSAEVKTLIGSTQRFPGHALSYLGLPGNDMLDIRSLHDEVCKPLQIKLRYLGFNERLREGDEGVISNNELLSQGYPLIEDEPSGVVPDALESVGDHGSMAYGTLCSRAPYDVVNFDLCDDIAKTPPRVQESTMTALATILEVQFEAQTQPWLLFLTTRVTRDGVDEKVLEIVENIVRHNCDRSSVFREKLRTTLGLEKLDLQALKGLILDDGTFDTIVAVGLCKWLIQFSASCVPLWEVSLVNMGFYKVHRDRDMYSLGFKFVRRNSPPVDNTGWTDLPLSRQMVSSSTEQDMACGAVEALGRIVDIDKLLAADPELFSAVVNDAARLMEEARYDRTKYLDWVSKGCLTRRSARRKKTSAGRVGTAAT